MKRKEKENERNKPQMSKITLGGKVLVFHVFPVRPDFLREFLENKGEKRIWVTHKSKSAQLCDKG